MKDEAEGRDKRCSQSCMVTTTEVKDQGERSDCRRGQQSAYPSWLGLHQPYVGRDLSKTHRFGFAGSRRD